MRFQSGVVDQYIYFIAVDVTDLKTRETGLTGFTVYRSRNGGAAASFTTPTVNETDATNMPGVYELLLDEDMTIDAGDDSQAVVLHITHASMAPVTLQYELYRPVVSAGTTALVDANGRVDVIKIAGTTQTARDIGASVLLSSGTGTGQLDFTSGVVKANVTQFGGTNATSSGGRPEVNTSHIAGSAVSTSSAQIGVNVVNLGGSAVDATSGLINANVKQISGDATAADNLESYTDGTTPMPVNATQFSGSATAADNAEVVFATDFATNYNTTADKWQVQADVTAISGDSTAADNCEAAFDGNTYNVGGGAVVAASVTGAVGSVTGNVGGNVTGSIGSLAAQAKADVNAEADTALVDINLDHLVKSAVDTDFATTVQANSVIGHLADNGAGFDRTTDSLEAIRDRGDAAWTTATGFSTHSAADVWAVATRRLTDATNISGPIADQVWEEAIADHSGTAGSTAEALGAAGSAGDPWNTALPGAYAAGKAGHILGTYLDEAVSGVPTANENADALLDRAAGVETNRTLRQTLRLILAVAVGKVSGGGSGTETFRDTNDSKDRVVSVNDENGNRTSVTLDAS